MFEHIIQLVRSIAWPLVVVTAILVFRIKLGDVLKSIERVKFGAIELELRQQAADVAAALSADGADLDDLTAFDGANNSVVAQISHEYGRLIAALQRLDPQIEAGSDSDNVSAMIDQLLNSGIIRVGSAEAARGLMTMRNLALRAGAGALPQSYVQQYRSLTDAAISSLSEEQE